MARPECDGDPTGGVVAGHDGGHGVARFGVQRLGEGEGGRTDGYRRVAPHQLGHVVELERVGRDSIGQRRVAAVARREVPITVAGPDDPPARSSAAHNERAGSTAEPAIAAPSQSMMQ